MRILVSFVNSPLALAGFDWENGELFWSVGSEGIRTCGICYDGDDLLIASDNQYTRFSASGAPCVTDLPGPHPALAHSIHPVGNGLIGVVDTGNSALRIYDRKGSLIRSLSPVAGWPQVPADAIHLNDFAVTPRGIIGSCFDVRPWRATQQALGGEAAQAGLGALLNLTDAGGCGRIVGCGIDHPHSLVYREPDLFHCSSGTGSFHAWRFNARGTLVERDRDEVSREHFLRGALPGGEHVWYLGGSTIRHGEVLCEQMGIYRLDESNGKVDRTTIPAADEIYDLLPWREEILGPIIARHF